MQLTKRRKNSIFTFVIRLGGVAQLVERLNGIQEVRGSTPLISTTTEKNEPDFIGFVFFSGALRGDAVRPAAWTPSGWRCVYASKLAHVAITQTLFATHPLISTTAEKNKPDFIGFFFFSGALHGDAVPPAAWTPSGWPQAKREASTCICGNRAQRTYPTIVRFVARMRSIVACNKSLSVDDRFCDIQGSPKDTFVLLGKRSTQAKEWALSRAIMRFQKRSVRRGGNLPEG